MSDYADDAASYGIDDWRGSEAPRGRGAQYWGRSRDLPPQYCHKPKRCNRCGEAPLYWEQVDGGWRLHAYEGGKYLLHTCAAKAAGDRCPERENATSNTAESAPEFPNGKAA